jgi:hypothetical protein
VHLLYDGTFNCFSTLTQSSVASNKTFTYKEAPLQYDYHDFVKAMIHELNDNKDVNKVSKNNTISIANLDTSNYFQQRVMPSHIHQLIVKLTLNTDSEGVLAQENILNATGAILTSEGARVPSSTLIAGNHHSKISLHFCKNCTICCERVSNAIVNQHQISLVDCNNHINHISLVGHNNLTDFIGHNGLGIASLVGLGVSLMGLGVSFIGGFVGFVGLGLISLGGLISDISLVGFIGLGLVSLVRLINHISLVSPIGFSGIIGLISQISLVSLSGISGINGRIRHNGLVGLISLIGLVRCVGLIELIKLIGLGNTGIIGFIDHNGLIRHIDLFGFSLVGHNGLVSIFSLVRLGFVGLNILVGLIGLVSLVGLVLGHISHISLVGLIGFIGLVGLISFGLNGLIGKGIIINSLQFEIEMKQSQHDLFWRES